MQCKINFAVQNVRLATKKRVKNRKFTYLLALVDACSFFFKNCKNILLTLWHMRFIFQRKVALRSPACVKKVQNRSLRRGGALLLLPESRVRGHSALVLSS